MYPAQSGTYTCPLATDGVADTSPSVFTTHLMPSRPAVSAFRTPGKGCVDEPWMSWPNMGQTDRACVNPWCCFVNGHTLGGASFVIRRCRARSSAQALRLSGRG